MALAFGRVVIYLSFVPDFGPLGQNPVRKKDESTLLPQANGTNPEIIVYEQ
jgi:hypothetical protein